MVTQLCVAHNSVVPPSGDIEKGGEGFDPGAAPSASVTARQCPCGLSRRTCIVLLALALVVVLAVGLGAGLGITRSKDQGAAPGGFLDSAPA